MTSVVADKVEQIILTIQSRSTKVILSVAHLTLHPLPGLLITVTDCVLISEPCSAPYRKYQTEIGAAQEANQ